MTLSEREIGATQAGRQHKQPPAPPPLYTRYCVAPRPTHPIGEPRFVHALLVAAWLGRLIDPLPHGAERPTTPPRSPA